MNYFRGIWIISEEYELFEGNMNYFRGIWLISEGYELFQCLGNCIRLLKEKKKERRIKIRREKEIEKIKKIKMLKNTSTLRIT